MKSATRGKIACMAGLAGLTLAGAFVLAEGNGPQQPWSPFKVHDMSRPKPPIVTPGTVSTPDAPGKAPSDAIVLFDGTNMDEWQAQGGGRADLQTRRWRHALQRSQIS